MHMEFTFKFASVRSLIFNRIHIQISTGNAIYLQMEHEYVFRFAIGYEFQDKSPFGWDTAYPDMESHIRIWNSISGYGNPIFR